MNFIKLSLPPLRRSWFCAHHSMSASYSRTPSHSRPSPMKLDHAADQYVWHLHWKCCSWEVWGGSTCQKTQLVLWGWSDHLARCLDSWWRASAAFLPSIDLPASYSHCWSCWCRWKCRNRFLLSRIGGDKTCCCLSKGVSTKIDHLQRLHMTDIPHGISA